MKNVTPSFATALSISVTAQGATLQWNGRTDRAYRIESSSDVAAANWQTITAIQGQNGKTAFGESPLVSVGQRFYRVLPPL